jgi:tetratricopeptide (TPR) repeat protein
VTRWLAPVALALALGATSCAYYNTFYLARKNYYRATEGAPYLIERTGTQQQHAQTQYFLKAVDYSKKVLASYPRSKWVDDAYVLWARALLGQNDPLQTVNMLSDFTERYPQSPLRAEATFYLGVGQRQARRYAGGLESFQAFLKLAPKHDLVPYALIESARCLVALERPAEAAETSGQLLERFPKSPLVTEARRTRAEALVAKGDFDQAREDYRYLGENALTDEERLGWLLREADCLEGARDFDAALALLRDALAHERPPAPPPSSGTATSTPGGGGSIGAPGTVIGTAASGGVAGGADRYGRVLLRIGTANLLGGRIEPALQAYRDVLRDYPRTALAAEAQYRIAYAYETAADDFEQARAEYAKVKEQGSGGGFSEQAAQRLAMLERLAQFRTAGGDTLEKRAEAGLVRAELYLFQQDKPERALQEYQRLAEEMRGTPYEAKAMTAQAWVLSRKLDRPAQADSILWAVVREHPATEAQLAARDYLEQAGQSVPQDLIRMPERLLARADTTHLTEPPLANAPLGPVSTADSARAATPAWQQAIFRVEQPIFRRPFGGATDSTRFAGPGAPADSAGFAAAPGPGDTTRTARAPSPPPVAIGTGAPGDTLGPAGPVPRGPRSPELTRALPGAPADSTPSPADSIQAPPDSSRARLGGAPVRPDSSRARLGGAPVRPDSSRARLGGVPVRPDSSRARLGALPARSDSARARADSARVRSGPRTVPRPGAAAADSARARADTTRAVADSVRARSDSTTVRPAPRTPRRPAGAPGGSVRAPSRASGARPPAAPADSARKRP